MKKLLFITAILISISAASQPYTVSSKYSNGSFGKPLLLRGVIGDSGIVIKSGTAYDTFVVRNGLASLSLATPNVIFATPVTFTGTSNAWSGTLSLNSQSAWNVFGNHTSGSATPTFGKMDVHSLSATGSAYDGAKVLYDDNTWKVPSTGFANPMTTSQDIIVGGSSGTPTRLGIGSEGQLLGVVGGNLVYTSLGITDTLAHTIYGNTVKSNPLVSTAVKLSLRDTAISTSSQQNYSPKFYVAGTYWTGAVSRKQGINQGWETASGGGGSWHWDLIADENFASPTSLMTLSGSGALVTAGGIQGTNITASTQFISSNYSPSSNGVTMNVGGNCTWSGSSASTLVNVAIGTFNNITRTAGTNIYTGLAPFYNESGSTTNNYDFVVNRTETALSSGIQRFASFQIAGAEKFAVDNKGKVFQTGTITAAGTTGAQTINKPLGSVNFAAGATSLVVTNSTVTTSSLVFCQIMTNDATATSTQCVVSSGSFTIYLNAAATAETKVAFHVIDAE